MEKINWKVIAVLTVLCILGGAYTLAFADTSVDQKTTLNGVVLADGLAAVGMQVRYWLKSKLLPVLRLQPELILPEK